ncbi:MAG: hypothetical protein PHN18_05435 [Sulfurospirillaceae bacterium]|nr:hypothetical protein [Sulfurospirillaceae bacterium]MDD2825752.1 hypothetical protein [Sulfurospirillaceae bacterium]
MRYIGLLFICSFSLHAGIYYAKVEPFLSYTLKASYSAEVTTSIIELEGKLATGGLIVQLDDGLDKKELKSSQDKLIALSKTAKLMQRNIANAQEIVRVKEDNYGRIKELKTKSKVDKDNELINFITAQNQLLSLEQSLENIHVQVSDLEYHIALLNDKIDKKNFHVRKGNLIYKIYVSKGDYVMAGSPVIDVYDVSEGKLTLYLSKEDKVLAERGVLYIDGQRSDSKVHKIWSVADTQNISAYRCEILLNKPHDFSVLKKIEFKEK